MVSKTVLIWKVLEVKAQLSIQIVGQRCNVNQVFGNSEGFGACELLALVVPIVSGRKYDMNYTLLYEIHKMFLRIDYLISMHVTCST